MVTRTVRLARSTASILVILTLLALTPFKAQAANRDPRVIPPTYKPYGSAYKQWSVKWWQWALSIPAPENPLLDETGANCDVGQSGHVWFLGGTFLAVETAEGNYLGEATRDCTIPAGKAIFFPVMNAECSTAEGNGETKKELRDCAIFLADHITSLSVTVDGVSLPNLDPPDSPYRVLSRLFKFTLPPDNLIGLDTGGVTIESPSVSDGYWIMLAPLSPGEHVIHFTGVATFGPDEGNFEFMLDITYNLTVVK